MLTSSMSAVLNWCTKRKTVSKYIKRNMNQTKKKTHEFATKNAKKQKYIWRHFVCDAIQKRNIRECFFFGVEVVRIFSTW